MTAEMSGPVYANVVKVSTGPFDVVMDFGLNLPGDPQDTEFKPVARVAMSLSHAKTMIPVLSKLIADYEKQWGEIPAPGFEERAKE